MNTHIALLRGINVGGNNKLPMRDLVSILQGLDLHNVKTYIQSGNAVFQSKRDDLAILSQEIGAAIEQHHGFNPQVFILSVDALQEAIAANPFPKAEDEPKTLHFFFWDGDPSNLDDDALNKMKKENEQFQRINSVLYLHAPDGISRSKLAESLSKKRTDVMITARNYRSASKILAMALDLAQ